MNTFLPHQNFADSAHTLDNKRLFKQAIEAKQIIAILTTGKTNDGRDYPLSMKHHPIVFAWTGYLEALKHYYNCCLDELENRGRKISLKAVTINLKKYQDPSWLTDEVCEMYQAHLLRKDYHHYSDYFTVDPTIPFNWLLLKNLK